MLKIGLTGGIGSGKSTVANIFTVLGIPVIDADIIARELVEPGSIGLKQIRQTFGDYVIGPDGNLNRSAMRELIFSDIEQKRKLEAILHPLIRQRIQTETRALEAPYCIICIPLLFETGMADLVDRVLVIDCPPEIQIERVQKRDRLEIKIIRSIIAAQAPRALRIAKADDLIDNSEPDSRLAEQVKTLHNLYLSLSARQDF